MTFENDTLLDTEVTVHVNEFWQWYIIEDMSYNSYKITFDNATVKDRSYDSTNSTFDNEI